MKQAKFFSILGLFIAGFTIQTVAQEQVLPEVTVLAHNYKYLKSVNTKDAPEPVKLLERKASAYDVKKSEFYEDDYDTYVVTFYLPEGYILAVYDQNGKLLRTAERFKNVQLPQAVRIAVVQNHPKWKIAEDTYLVKYEDAKGGSMIYKLLLENGNKRLRVKTNEKGEFLK